LRAARLPGQLRKARISFPLNGPSRFRPPWSPRSTRPSSGARWPQPRRRWARN
jgi:hypothetical protein